MKTRKKILGEVMAAAAPKFDISLLTDQQLDDLEAIMKRDGVQFISVEKAIQRGFIVPDNPETILTNLIKFYKYENHQRMA